MEKICNIQNIGIYLSVENEKRRQIVKERLLQQTDGFEIYYRDIAEQKRIIVKDLQEIKTESSAIIVPDNACYQKDGTFISYEAQIAFQFTDFGMNFWADKNLWYLPYMLQYLLEDADSTFIHGASVAVNGNEGYLLVAFGGIGKTCFVSQAVKRDGVTLLGDDLIIVKKSGELLSYPRPFCLYGYHRRLFPQFFENKKVYFVEVKQHQYFRRACRKLHDMIGMSDRVIFNFLPVSPIHLFPKEKMQIHAVPVKKVFVLRRLCGIDRIQINETRELDKVASFAHNVIQHEWSVGIRLEYNFLAHREESYCSRAQRQYEVIKGCFTHAEHVYYVDIPEKMGAEEVSQKLNELLLGRVGENKC